MQNTITQTVLGMTDRASREAVSNALTPVADRLSSQTLTSAALRIKGGSASAIVQTNAVYVGVCQGILVTVASGTDMPALVGTVVNATFNVFAIFITRAGTRTTRMGRAGATLAAVVLPEPPAGSAYMGFVIINPTGTGNFVGGTTVLDDATVAPNAVFVNTVGAFDPTIRM